MSLDLAEVVEDLICTFEGNGDTTMDTLAMFVFGWILAALFILWIGKFVYGKVMAKWEQAKAPEGEKVTDVVDAKKVTKSSSVRASPAPSRGPGGYVPPTPPVRKRLTRASPGPELRKPTKYIPAPQCTGPDNISVLWVNDVFQWLYNDHEIVYELLDYWIRSLNEYMKKTAVDQGITVELIRILPETNPPMIGNVFAECDSKDDVTITCDCEATPAFQLKSLRQKDDKIETSHFRINVNRFRARLNIYCVTEKLQAEIKCDGWPEIKVALAPVGNIKNSLDENHLQEVISDIFVNALRNTEVHLNLAQYSQCPKLIRHVEMPGKFLPVHYDSMNRAYTSTPNHVTPDTPVNTSGKRLLVKVVRAAQLGGPQGCKDPYCVVEMDEPSQKNQTSIQKGTDSPSWEEHFLLDVTNNTSEILFEVYDHADTPHRFLGVGIVGLDELLVNPSQRQIISLQGRPYESDPISGTLTVEFMFIENADIPFIEGSSRPYKIKETIPNPIVPRNVNTISNSPSFRHTDNLTNGNHLNDSLAHRDYGLNSTDDSTIIIHSIQKQPSQRIIKVELVDGVWKEVEEKTEESDGNQEEKSNVLDDSGVFTNGGTNGKVLSDSVLDSSNANNTVDSQASEPTMDRSPVTGVATPIIPDEPPPQEFRGRSKKRRDFFGTIKRRLGRSKNRSRSAGPENDVGRDDSLNRSVSADRNRNDGYQLNVPGQRSMEESSRRSSLSEASGLSTASGRTYVNEASALVLETVENGIKKHYLVPLSLAQKSKWRKKGIKLHIFNDHTFIAKHLSGGTQCQVCMKSIARRLGKQGYECRDCQMKCHKHCHVKVNDNCPTSTIHNIELNYITNPYTDKNLRML